MHIHNSIHSSKKRTAQKQKAVTITNNDTIDTWDTPVKRSQKSNEVNMPQKKRGQPRKKKNITVEQDQDTTLQ